MKIKEFNKLKFFRTYIGGSKKNEKKFFEKIEGTMEDNSDCDWFVFRRMLYVQYYDILNVIFSWKILLKKLKYIFIVIGFLFLINNLFFFLLFFILSIISNLVSNYLEKYEKRILSNYTLCLNIILDEINRLTGLNLD